ncbi:MAG: ATP-binding protein [Syntrophales bacterium]|nr:ATP-binding protein [Syntrophales bacterium]
MDNDRLVERRLLLEELRYSGIILKLGKSVEEPYCCQFNDEGYDRQYARFDNETAIQKIIEKVTDEELVSFFNDNPVVGYIFKGRFYTLRNGALVLNTEWTEIKGNLWRLEGKYPSGSVTAVLAACYEICVRMNKQSNNYMHIQSVARDLGAGNFREVLTDLELAEIIVKHKSDIRIPPERMLLAEEFLKESREEKKATQEEDTPRVEMPDGLFEVIEGYEDVKALVRRVLANEKPVHILFTGVPGSAKTMFLLELARCGAPYILGSQSTKAGIVDLLFDTEPEILLVDEIDRFGRKDIAVLLSLTQTGIVSETKMGKRREIRLRTKVFAASNTLKMAPELLSRFMVLRFKPYSRDEFLLVAANLLRKTEGIDGDLAGYITERVWSLSRRFPDPRQAIRVARLAKTREEVDSLLQTVMKYSDSGG